MGVMYTYRAYGMMLRVPFACAELSREAADLEADVIVEEGEVPPQLACPAASDTIWEAEPGRTLLRCGPRAGRFLVEGSHKVTLQRGYAAEESMLAFHFLSTVLSAVLRQRGFLVLHASSAVTPCGAVAIAGESGAGKSTTLAALVRRGCAMLSDDITALRVDAQRRVVALPGVPMLHLCEDAAEGLNLDLGGARRFGGQRQKAAFASYTAMAPDPVPLRAIYLLSVHPQGEFSIRALKGAEKFAAIHASLFGPLLPDDHPGLFPTLAVLTDQADVYGIQRPRQSWTVEQAVEAILNG